MAKLKFKLLPIALLICLISPAVLLACLWDYDTLKMERSRFPTTIELITGKFLRHTPEFYEWRIKDREKRLEKDPNNVQLLDDLAVAYDKTGQQDKAIEIAEKTEKIKPGRYETLANLGTFYFHAGKLEEGLPYIDKALKINPDAHFGREYYQKILVEYVLQQRKNNPKKLPLADVIQEKDRSNPKIKNNFVGYLYIKLHPETVKDLDDITDLSYFANKFKDEEILKATTGILGMMRFGSHNSPILLEALGSILSPNSRNRRDAKLLACRAYLKASYEAPTEQARNDYRMMAQNSLTLQNSSPNLDYVEPLFKKELNEGKEWYEELQKNEISWIQEGKNPELEFDKLYAADPVIEGSYSILERLKIAYNDVSFHNPDDQFKIIFAAIISIIILLLIKRKLKQKKQN